MGGEHSKDVLPVFEGESIIVSDAYVLRQGHFENGEACSVFSGAVSPTLLSSAKNLKTHRHPSIIRYLSSGQEKERLHVVTEPVLPLSRVVKEQTTLQICVGLHSIISALSFLHDKAYASHNNVCCASIYVTPDGIWKLGGLEFMLKLSDTTAESLTILRDRRYAAAIPPEESRGRVLPSAIDIFGLGVLITELLKNKEDEELPSLGDIQEFCQNRMVINDPKARPTLSEVAAHPFFSHEFIRIHRFLTELPVRTAEEKLEFFRELEQQLLLLPETMVASQLLSLLLARVVVLDVAAQNHLLPSLLSPRSETHPDGCMFSEPVFSKYVIPKLLQMFRVRDTSVRLLLLSYLPRFLHTMTKEELRTELLPELLLGVKDLDDELVAATLQALATLVGVLGGEAVVGGKRAKLFSDGRPATRKPRSAPALPERPSPDGGEDCSADDIVAWSDWEQQSEKEPESLPSVQTPIMESPVKVALEPKIPPQQWSVGKPSATLADLDSLDIKSPSAWRPGTEDDFFRDMEPIIRRTEVLPVSEKTETDKFQVCDAGLAGDEWDSFEEWGEPTS